MSATRGLNSSVRDPDDFYATPPELALLVCSILKQEGWAEAPTRIVEPGSGTGNWIWAIEHVWPTARVTALERNDTRYDLCRGRYGDVHDVRLCDVLFEPLDGRDFDLAIGNPPFRYAQTFIQKSYSSLKVGGALAFLLRLPYLESAGRFETLWSVLPPSHVYVLPVRPAFVVGTNGDASAYMICVWRRTPDGVPRPRVWTMSFIDNTNIDNKLRSAEHPTPRADVHAVLVHHPLETE